MRAVEHLVIIAHSLNLLAFMLDNPGSSIIIIIADELVCYQCVIVLLAGGIINVLELE